MPRSHRTREILAERCPELVKLLDRYVRRKRTKRTRLDAERLVDTCLDEVVCEIAQAYEVMSEVNLITTILTEAREWQHASRGSSWHSSKTCGTTTPSPSWRRSVISEVSSRCRRPYRIVSLAGRRKTALFLAAFRGHRIGVERLIEQAYGYVGECALCGMICKVPREQAGGDAVQGRAVEFDCPCGRCPGPAKETA